MDFFARVRRMFVRRSEATEHQCFIYWIEIGLREMKSRFTAYKN